MNNPSSFSSADLVNLVLSCVYQGAPEDALDSFLEQTCILAQASCCGIALMHPDSDQSLLYARLHRRADQSGSIPDPETLPLPGVPSLNSCTGTNSPLWDIPGCQSRMQTFCENRKPFAWLEVHGTPGISPLLPDMDQNLHQVLEKSLLLLRTQLIHHKSDDGRQYQSLFIDLLFRFSHDMIITCTTEGTILRINKGGREILGIPPEDPLTGARLEIESPPLDFLLHVLAEENVVHDMEIVLLNKAGKALFCEGNFIAQRDAGGKIALIHGMCRNINDRIDTQKELWLNNIQLNQMNEELVQTQTQAIQNEKLAAIGQLAAGIAHEINNPLGFVQSNHETMSKYIDRLCRYIQVLESSLGNPDEVRKQNQVHRIIPDLPQVLAESSQGFERISAIVKSLKDFSRMENSAELCMVEINRLIEDTLVVARNSWKYVAQVQTDLRLAEPIEAYPGLLNQVFLNLVVNSAQAIGALKKESLGTILISSEKKGNSAILVFQDDGPGVPLPLRNKIFNPFFTTKPIGEGTGLGLSVSYDIIVKKHHGRIDVGDAPGGGARFTITLPLLQAEGCMDTQDV